MWKSVNRPVGTSGRSIAKSSGRHIAFPTDRTSGSHTFFPLSSARTLPPIPGTMTKR